MFMKARLKGDCRIGCVINHDVNGIVTVDYGWGMTISAPKESFIILPSEVLMSTPDYPEKGTC